MIPLGGSRYSLGFGALSAALLLYACSGSKRNYDDGGEGGSGAGSGDPGGSGSSGSGAGKGGSDGSGGRAGAAGSSSGGATGGGAGTSGEAGAGGAPEPEPCGGLVCLHGGACVGEGENASCDCAGTGYQGETCEEDVDECGAEPCENGTTCANSDGSYSCDCSSAPNYVGQNCDLLRFEPLPEDFIPYDVSPEGDVVVGANKNTLAYKYVDGEEVFLGFLIGDNASAAYGASDDGKVVVGASGTNSLYDTSRAVRWDGPDITPLEEADGYTMCSATGVSADGNVIVGICVHDAYTVVRWVNGEFEPVGIAEGVESCSIAVVSDDGSTIGGMCSIYPSNRGFVWTEEAGFKLLPTLEDATNCNLSGLSADGKAATGECVSGNAGPGSAFLWTSADGTKALPKDPTINNGYGVALSADGLRVLGADVGAALWDDPEAAPTELVDLLPSDSPGLSDWYLGVPIALSADGKTIVGQGSVENVTRRYIARLDE